MTMTRLGRPTLLGIPFDAYSSYLRGAGEAPGKIREALRCDASNSWTELRVDLGAAGAFEDASREGKWPNQTGFFNRRRARGKPIPARISSDEPGSGVPVELPPVAVTLSMYSKGVGPGVL